MVLFQITEGRYPNSMEMMLLDASNRLHHVVDNFQMNLSQINMGQMNMGQMNMGQMNMGQMNMGQINMGQMNMGQMNMVQPVPEEKLDGQLDGGAKAKSKPSSSKGTKKAKPSSSKGKHKGGDDSAGVGSDFATTLASRGPCNYPDGKSADLFRIFNKTSEFIPNSMLKYAAAPVSTGYAPDPNPYPRAYNDDFIGGTKKRKPEKKSSSSSKTKAKKPAKKSSSSSKTKAKKPAKKSSSSKTKAKKPVKKH
jgi:hypothetical protein